MPAIETLRPQKLVRGRLLWFVDDPAASGEKAVRYIEDGALVIANGYVANAGDAASLLRDMPAGTPVADYRPHLVMPGFIDPHIHFPQTQVIASHGAQLLDWLTTYAFVEEQKFADPAHVARVASFFFDELLSNGTTTAAAFCSVHPQSVEGFFAESVRRNTRMVCGKVMMDRNAPPGLLDTAQTGYADSKALIGKWHRKGRQIYAISPRFAITSTPEQLEAAGTLSREHPDCLVQTHICENPGEIAMVRSLFPNCADYTAVYEKYGLLAPRSLMGHCIHMGEDERRRFSQAGAVAVFCPTSNLFLGSGLFDWQAMRAPERPVRLGIATDVGGGTSYGLLQTLNEAYKILQLQGQKLTAFSAFHGITRGNALALGLGGVIGSFAIGAECDAVVLDARATPAMRHRMETVTTLAEELFVLMTMGDDRAIVETCVMGQPSKPRQARPGGLR